MCKHKVLSSLQRLPTLDSDDLSALAFRDAPLLRPPKPATAQTQTLGAIAKKNQDLRMTSQNLSGKEAYDWTNKLLNSKGIDISNHLNDIEYFLSDELHINITSKTDYSSFLYECVDNNDGTFHLKGTLTLKQTERITNALVHELLHFFMGTKGIPLCFSPQTGQSMNIDTLGDVNNILQHKLTYPIYLELGLEPEKFMTFSEKNYNGYEQSKSDIRWWTWEYFSNLYSLNIATVTQKERLFQNLLTINSICNTFMPAEFSRRKQDLDLLYSTYDSLEIDNYKDYYARVLDIFQEPYPNYLAFKDNQIVEGTIGKK